MRIAFVTNATCVVKTFSILCILYVYFMLICLFNSVKIQKDMDIKCELCSFIKNSAHPLKLPAILLIWILLCVIFWSYLSFIVATTSNRDSVQAVRRLGAGASDQPQLTLSPYGGVLYPALPVAEPFSQREELR